MTDKEVGILWREARGIKDEFTPYRRRDVIELICKLVEERAAVHDHGDYTNDEQHQACMERALAGFGIDPEEFLEVSGALAQSDPASK